MQIHTDSHQLDIFSHRQDIVKNATVNSLGLDGDILRLVAVAAALVEVGGQSGPCLGLGIWLHMLIIVCLRAFDYAPSISL